MQGQQAVGFLLDHGIALAAELFQARPVQHCNVSTLIGDHTELLQLAGGLGDAFAAHAEHVSDELLGLLHTSRRATADPRNEHGRSGYEWSRSEGKRWTR